MNKYRNYIIGYISRTRKKAQRFLERELKNHGLEELIPSHGSILSVLYENGGKLTMKEIADLIRRDKSTVTALANKLVKLGYIEKQKCEEDKRITYIVLTEKGKSIKNKFDLISKNLIDTAYKGFTEEEEDMLAKLLNKLNQNFSQK
ncbi:MarR family winged helix-turn-helix transcriptional regulator [Tepidibacter formicigenes]|jgi:DNA-binding MarR family transcriptional regulator|uniref:DNA-binding transcriptional regulator, MarR family n=1 Tax=Tepidibacter formicigenes DSM 15518 TaxID=1123349 RepID=A0A1M6KYX8_9FIRM|nr:MarR family transcriptional regulator [Tepidibacter formicigenes]SHJ64157.1 DNA-binding transcriptional regulator, MarR family [Tepidibacter formicigenes DSM 15518]